MIYLILAIICSAAISVLMRFGEDKCKSNRGMFIFNYLICTLAAAFYLPEKMGNTGEGSAMHVTTLLQELLKSEGLSYAVGLGVITGIFFLATFVLLQKNIRKNGVVLAAIFMRLGVIVPVMLSILLWREHPQIRQIAGVLIAITAILVFNYDKNMLQGSADSHRTPAILWLLILLISSGTTDSMINIFNHTGNAYLSDLFLVLTFFFALLGSIAMYIAQKEKLGKWDIIFGILIGIPNYYSSRFLMLALLSVPGIVAYPVYSVLTLLAICVAGLAFFREKLSRQRLAGLLLVLAAVALLA